MKFIAPQPDDAQNYTDTYRYPKIGDGTGITVIKEDGSFVVYFRFNHFFSSSLDHHTLYFNLGGNYLSRKWRIVERKYLGRG